MRTIVSVVLGRWWTWLILGILILLVLAWLTWGGAVTTWYRDLRGAQKENTQVLHNLGKEKAQIAKDKADLEAARKETARLKTDRQVALKRAAEAEKESTKWAAEVARLKAIQKTIDTTPPLPSPQSIQEIIDALAQLGY